MAYIPIKSRSVEADTESGIPANTTRKYLQENAGVSGSFSDYLPTLYSTGDFTKVIDINVILTSIKNLLLTPVGSYPFDPLYGSDLVKKVFDPADEITASEIKEETIEKIKIYEPRANVVDVFTEFYSNGKGYRVNLTIQRGNATAKLNVDITEDLGFSIEEG